MAVEIPDLIEKFLIQPKESSQEKEKAGASA